MQFVRGTVMQCHVKKQLITMQESLVRALHASGISLNENSVTRYDLMWSAARACIDMTIRTEQVCRILAIYSA
jgi:hypothetical protein